MDRIYRQAIELQNRFRSYVDQPNHPAMAGLRDEIQKLTDEIEMKKNKLSLEERVKSLIRRLEAIPGDQLMDHRDIDDLIDRCNDLRNDIRKL